MFVWPVRDISLTLQSHGIQWECYVHIRSDYDISYQIKEKVFALYKYKLLLTF